MEKLEEALSDWRAMPVSRINLKDINTDEALQPRAERLIQWKARGRYEDWSTEHIARMRTTLEASRDSDLDPLLVADIGGLFFIVDGHHRLAAYRLAKRSTLPARVRPMTREAAALLSKLVNLGGVKLPMHPEQARDAAWQYLAHVTLRGNRGLPKGHSTRTVAARFGISHGTVAAMLQRLPKVTLEEYTPESLDSGTGWPRWKYVKDAAWRNDDAPLEHRLQRAAERVAKAVAKLKDKEGPIAFQRGIALLMQEVAGGGAEGEPWVQLDQWAALDDENGRDPF